MVGAVAMESLIEDYGHQQQCKKNRSDLDERGVRPRAITSYFSPLRRQQDGGAEVAATSVPRPADLLGYFPRMERTLPAEEKGSRADGKTLTSAARKTLDQSRNKNDDVDEPAKEKRQNEGGRKRLSIKKSQASGRASGSGCTNKPMTDNLKMGTLILISDSSLSQDDGLSPIQSLVASASVEMVKPVDLKICSGDAEAVDYSPRRTASLGESSSGAADTSMLNTSLEVKLSSQSTDQEGPVTISYEDFIISCHQAEDRRGNAPNAEAAGIHSLSAEGTDAASSGIPGDTLAHVRMPSPVGQNASPTLLTVNVEIHSSPEHEALAAPRGNLAKQKRVANIFNLTKNKGKQSDADCMRKPTASKKSVPSRKQHKALESNATASGKQTLPNKIADNPESKRGVSSATTRAAGDNTAMKPCLRSNVAVLVDDELLELDANGLLVVPTCSKAERREFMAAFTKPRGDMFKTRGTQHKRATSPRESLQDGSMANETLSPASDGDARRTCPSNRVAEAGRTLKKRRWRRDAQSPESEEEETLPVKRDTALKSATYTGKGTAPSPMQRLEVLDQGARKKGKKNVNRRVPVRRDVIQVGEQEVEKDNKQSEVVMACKSRKENKILVSVHGTDETERQIVTTRTRWSGRRSGAEIKDADMGKKPADSANLQADSTVSRLRRRQSYTLRASVKNQTGVSDSAELAALPKASRRSKVKCLNFDGEGCPGKPAPAARSGEAGEVQIKREASALGVYRSELLSAHGPIRLKLTRVASENVEIGASDEELFTPRSLKLKKKIKRRSAEVAEEEGGEEKKAVVDTGAAPRRSCRRKSSPPILVEEDDKEEDGGRGEKTRKRTALRVASRRSINDVLGKVATSKPDRRPRHPTAQGKGASANLCGNKPAQSEPPHGQEIYISDDSSSECSENSNDGEASRSRREFLKSGLPDKLLRQRAREAAALDIYAAAFRAFPTTTHVQQKELGCELWSLPFPTSALLRTLAGHTETPAMYAGTLGGHLPALELGMCTWAKLSVARSFARQQCGTRPAMADTTRHALLADIKAAHPKFPARRFLAQMQERHVAATPTCDGSAGATKEPLMVEMSGSGQCKRKANEASEARTQRAKKRRCSAEIQTHADGQTTLVIGDHRNSEAVPVAKDRSRLRRRRGREEASVTAVVQEGRTDCGKSQPEAAQVSEGLLGEVCDDLLWTEKYQPRSKDEIIGNSSAVRKLHGWLKEWKSRADREAERASRREKIESHVKTSKGSESDFQSESGDASSSSEDEDSLFHGMLLTGPPGIGKTAAVYACAQELGFKVFEVNCSSQRSGRHILAQLREATQSHQVSKQHAGAHGAVLRAPVTASSLAAGDGRSTSKQQGSSARHASPVKVLRSPRKRPVAVHDSAAAAAKKRELPAAFAKFIKVNPAKGSEGNDKEPAEKMLSREIKQNKQGDASSRRYNPAENAVVAGTHSSSGSLAVGLQRREHTTATSLILFEEVDVVFDDDTGFLSAIRTFMATTKRPIVLTTSDPTFYLTFDGHYEQIYFKTPSMASVVPYLQVACVAEGHHVSGADVAALLAHVRGDVRRALLSLQLWVRSGGATVRGAQPQPSAGRDEGVGCEAVPAQVALCETRCAESLLGFSGVLGLHSSLYSLLTEVESDGSLEQQVHALTQTQQLGLDFICCNWELLLPLPVARCCDTPDVLSRTVPASSVSEKPTPEQSTRSKLELGYENDSSPVKVLRGGFRQRRQRKLLFFDSDIYDSEESSRDVPRTPRSPYAANVDSESSNGTTEGCGAQRGMAASRQGPTDTDGGEEVKLVDGAESIGRVGPAVRPRSAEERQAARAALHCLDAVSQLTDLFSCMDCRLARFDDEAEGLCTASLSNWWPAERKSGLLDATRIGEWDAGNDKRDGMSSEIRAAVEALALRRCRSGVSLALESAPLRPELRETLSLQVPESKEASKFLPESLEVTRASKERRALAQLVAPSCVALSALCVRRAVATDYLPALRQVCRTERLRAEAHTRRRFHHYLEEKLELSRSTLAALSADFP